MNTLCELLPFIFFCSELDVLIYEQILMRSGTVPGAFVRFSAQNVRAIALGRPISSTGGVANCLSSGHLLVYRAEQIPKYARVEAKGVAVG